MAKLIVEAKRPTPPEELNASFPYIDKITKLLFGVDGDFVVDPKRGREHLYYGVMNYPSKLKDSEGRPLRLTFDNSTDSTEFELDSVLPLMIERDSDADKKIRALYMTHEIYSRKRIKYANKGGLTVIDEIHVGRFPDQSTVDFIKDLIPLLRTRGIGIQ